MDMPQHWQREAPLVQFAGNRPPAPEWFSQFMARPAESRMVDVDGCAIESMAWGDPDAQSVLLLHGARGHARWWLPVIPLLARRYRVVAMSFSGMGLSGRRARYSVRQMAEEAWAVACDHSLLANARQPVVVAHSFGGKPAGIVAGQHSDQLLGTILVDSQIVPGPDYDKLPSTRRKIYPTERDALARFRLVPEQPAVEAWAVDALGRGGIVQAEGGWGWQFDPEFFEKLEFETGWEDLLRATCPLGFIRGAMTTIVTEREVEIQRKSLVPGTIFVDIAEAHHHIMVDQPIALATAIDTMIQGWRRTACT